MELTHIEHLGIAVKSIEACLPYYGIFFKSFSGNSTFSL